MNIKKSDCHIHKTIEDKFKFIQNYSSEYSVVNMCIALKVSRSGYYGYLSRPLFKRKEKDLKILEKIKSIHKKHPSFGIKPMHSRVKKEISCSHETIRRICKQNNIKSKRKTKWKATTNSKHNLPVAPNLLAKNFNVEAPNKVCST